MRPIRILVHSLLFCLAAAPVAAQQAAPAPETVRRPDEEVARMVDEHMRRIAAFGFSGSLLVAKDGKVLVEEGYGLADRASGRAYTAETGGDIGSITKQFTAAAILRLEMEGKLRVGDPITRFFPGVPEDKRGITLHHLLTHSAGLEDVFGGDYEVAERDSLVRVALASPLLWAPGTRYQYSNLGYTLLGAVVEIASGVPYERYLRERLWEPAGMRKTGYRGGGWSSATLAHGYRPDGADWGTALDRAWAPDGPWWNLRGNGGILSTVGDLYRWHRALEGTAILSDEAKAKLFAPHVAMDEEGSSRYGYGWAVSTTARGTRLIAHNGSNGVFYAELRRYVDEGVAMLVMSNDAEMNGALALQGVARIVFGMPYTPPPAPVPADAAALASLAGTYRPASGGTLTVTADGGALRIAAETPEALSALTGARADPAAEARTRRVVEALDAARGGDYVLLRRLYGEDRPLEAVAESYRRNLGTLEARLGPIRALRPLVTVRDPAGRVFTFVVLEQERGTQLFRLRWDGDAVVALGAAQAAGVARFLPVEGGGFASYDLRTGAVTRARFDGGTLVLATDAGETRAEREP